MASLNKVMIMGNLTRDPDLRYTAGGSAVCNFSIATNRKFKQGEEWKEETEYHNITVWGKQGENCAQYLRKGRSAFVEGRLQTREYEAKEGGKRKATDVIADSVQFIGGNTDNK
jgi:single-strand DNA-binding protein